MLKLPMKGVVSLLVTHSLTAGKRHYGGATMAPLGSCVLVVGNPLATTPYTPRHTICIRT